MSSTFVHDGRAFWAALRLALVAPALAIACAESPPTEAARDAGEGGAVDAGPWIDVGAFADSGPPGPASVLEEHVHANRDGLYTDSSVTLAAAAKLHIDTKFDAVFDGISFGEMLYVDGFRPKLDALFVASSGNHVTALDAATGQPIWDKVLGPVVVGGTAACPQPGTPNYGIMSTPIIDPATRTLYVESFQAPAGATPPQTTLVYAMSIDDGAIRPGWPVDVGKVVPGFDSTVQHPRAGLALLHGTVYVPFSSIYDCKDYHGWVVGISTTDPTHVTSWATSANRGGIWGGLLSDGTGLFTSTGNTATKTWGGGEAVIHLPADLAFSNRPVDYFSPSNWKELDEGDLDLGSASPLLFDVPGATPSKLLVAIGKAGVLFLLDRSNLGGIGKGDGKNGEGLYSKKIVDGSGMYGRGTTYATAKGRYVVFRAYGAPLGCPKGTSGDLVALRIEPNSPPTFSVAWCAVSHGHGSPVVTTTDGESEPIVWVPATGAVNRLYGFDGETGGIVFGGGGTGDGMTTLWRWASPVVAKGRFYVAGQGKVHAFTFE